MNSMRRLTVFLLALLAVPLTAQTAHEMLVSTEWLGNHPDGITIVEIGDRATYAAGHVPGAVLIETGELLSQQEGTPNELPSIEMLEAVLTRIGVGNRGRIILYSRDPILAVRAWFTLDYLGHGQRAAVLDGGFTRWVDEARPTSSAVPAMRSVPFHANVDAAALTRIKAMKELVRDREVRSSSLVIIDARPPQQFSGAEAGSAVTRAGHIPGAVNVPWNENLTAGGVPRFLPESELRELYASAGVNAKSTNVVYCRTGMLSSLTYFALRYLGYDATMYDGSYLEWSRDPALPVVEPSAAEHRGQPKGHVHAHDANPVLGLPTNPR